VVAVLLGLAEVVGLVFGFDVLDEVAGTGVTLGDDGLEEPLEWGPSTHTMATVNTISAADAAAAVTISRRGRGGLYGARGLIAS
jgi:hypothetical protein